MKVKCPACGTVGTDVPPELGGEEADYRFDVYGRDGGRVVRKCLTCGGGVYVKLLPPRYAAIPEPRWMEMQEFFEQEMEVRDAERERLREQAERERGR